MITTFSLAASKFERDCAAFIKQNGMNMFVDTVVGAINDADSMGIWEESMRASVEKLHHTLSGISKRLHQERKDKERQNARLER